MKTKFLLSFLLMSVTFANSLVAERPDLVLTNGWKFIKQDVAPDASTDGWSSVTVPHTWNAVDGQNGKAADPDLPEGYYRGPGWYARKLDAPSAWKGKRVFIRFEAAALIADVYVNGTHLGQHRGGFAAFCYELTPLLHFDGKDSLRVRVDNARNMDVAPLSGDFTVFGGLYRPVHLFAADPVCVTPLDSGSRGFYLTLKSLAEDAATVEAKALISNGGSSDERVRVEVEVKDATGKAVANQSSETTIGAGKTEPVIQTISIARPHAWNARKDPYLYSATVRVVRDGKAVDEVVQPLGLRTVAITQEAGFVLNSKPYPLHGVNRHQERKDKGWAVSEEDHRQDIGLIVETGATALRLAHYQQSNFVHDLCDRAGLVVWQEIPLVDAVGGSEAFLENARQQLREMILQGWNHPSLSMWGLFNELQAKWAAVKTAPPEPVIQSLQVLAKELDPSRPTVAASYMQQASPLHSIPDWIAFNVYPGWYSGQPEDFTKIVDKVSGLLNGKRVAISEYGAGANPNHHEEGTPKKPKQDGPFHPEEWQTYLHESLWAQSVKNPHLWGTYAWVMFDFAVEKRNEGGVPALNDKGLVTRDRKVKKDAFYFYKANWTEEPMVYIASRRMTPRKQATTQVKVYSNCGEVELKVNGKSLGLTKPDDVRIFRWENVELQAGTNRIEATARVGEKAIGDKCEWILKP